MPAISGWLSGIVPQPISVGMTGTPVTSANSTSSGDASALMMPPPATINGRSAAELIGDESWLKETFIPAVQQRGAAIITARGSSSAGSAANAIVETVRSLTNDRVESDWHSVAVCSDGSYGVEKGLLCSFPVRTRAGKWEIVQGVPLNEFGRAKIDASVAELKEERALVGELIG